MVKVVTVSQFYSITGKRGGGGTLFRRWIAILAVVARRFAKGFEEFADEGGYGEVAARGAKTSVVVDFVGNTYGDMTHGFCVSICIVRRGAIILGNAAAEVFDG
jgi:hypothetical protein